MKNKKYDVAYFIKKFEAIPEELWIQGILTDHKDRSKHCALGHCGLKSYKYEFATEEAKELIRIFGGDPDLSYPNGSLRGFSKVAMINDRGGVNPKANILAFLYNKQKSNTEEKIRYVVVEIDSAIKEKCTELTLNN